MPFDFAPELNDVGFEWFSKLEDQIAYWKSRIAEEGQLQTTIDFETRSPTDIKKRGGFLYSLDPATEAMCLAYHLPGETEVKLWHMAHPEFLIGESPAPVDLFAFILAGGLVEAHNAFFERCIWTNIMIPRYGWPVIKPDQWRCSAAKASAMSLPRSLEEAVAAMDLGIDKDMEGRKLMLKMCKPRKLRKAEMEKWMHDTGHKGRAPAYKSPGYPIVYHETEEDLHRLWDYCKQDVFAEHALSLSLPELSEQELETWKMDQWLNWRGARFDLTMAKQALSMASEWRKRLNSILEALTGITSATKRAAVKEWLVEEEDLDLPDTAADTLKHYLENEELSARARRVLEIVRDVNKTSTRKYNAMIDKAWEGDERARDLMMYHGAGTGRWAGKGIQVHNFPARDLVVKDFDEAAELILDGDLDWCHALYGDVMAFLSHALRGAILAEEGRELMVADYAAIEARCVLWEADDQQGLGVFRRGDDIYCDMATGIYGFEVQKKIAKDWTHPDYTLHSGCRQFGKQAILGLGYGMGYMTFLLTCRKYGITFSRAEVLRIMGPEKLDKTEEWVRKQLCLDTPPSKMTPEEAKRYSARKRQAARSRRRLIEAREDPAKIVHELALMKHTVDIYRARYPQVKAMWSDQEACAIQAVKSLPTPEELTQLHDNGIELPREVFTASDPVECGKVKWYMSEARTVVDALAGTIHVKQGKWLHCELPSGRRMSYCDPQIKLTKTSWGETKPALRYMSVDGVTRKWVRTATYGGKIVENITQAVARDIMAEAMLNSVKEGCPYDPIMSVHDELVCEVDEDKGDLKEFETLMSDLPIWAAGCPIVAEAERFKRYRK
ncbi:DNA polymerase [Roseobacter phage RDJL Phi 2]|uniref:DNA polymerase A domain protein n=1 Tax=Roseobacter phage RDJL Phi 2 TaxID=1682380 RepID=A0A0K0PVR6_9CAUD|nr:DNA polymerase [Roseobacter phage RDJL Phi 2]AKQ75814.1 DNA polymerase A domain protein [Roseobacter phage RDJL Phi 2]